MWRVIWAKNRTCVWMTWWHVCEWLDGLCVNHLMTCVWMTWWLVFRPDVTFAVYSTLNAKNESLCQSNRMEQNVKPQYLSNFHLIKRCLHGALGVWNESSIYANEHSLFNWYQQKFTLFFYSSLTPTPTPEKNQCSDTHKRHRQDSKLCRTNLHI